MCINILNSQQVREMMENETFDLIILDIFLSESFFGFGEYFGAPMVGVSSLGTIHSVEVLVGNSSPLSYIADLTILRPYNSNMNFWLRCLNVAMFSLEWIHYYYRYMPVQKKIYEHHFPNASLTFEEAQKNFSLALTNDHFTLSTSRPHVPNMIEVAGLHIPVNLEPIPLHLNRTLQEADHGVVVVDLGSRISVHLMNNLLDQFRQIPQTILWHIDYTISARNVDIPSNVYFVSNLSRHSSLSYPNTHLFVCRGVYLDVVESIHYGIPILGVPNIDGSQEDYVDFIKKINNGLSLRLNQLNPETLNKVLKDLLTTDRYRREAVALSKRFRDQQNTPMEKSIYWIEYILRHNGATHMRNLGQNLKLWEYYNLDVLGCLMFVIISLICFAYIALKLGMRVLRVLKIPKTKNIKCE